MQQYYTLEEAAKKLGMSPDELREMAKSKKIRAFQDRGSWRFRTQDVEEEARKRGADSGPELSLGEAPSSSTSKRQSKLARQKPADEDALAVDFDLDEKPSPGRSSKIGPRSPKPKASSGDSDVKLVMDSELDFNVDADAETKSPPPPRPSKLGGGRKSKVHPGDSGVRLTERPSDSDVKVVPAANDSDVKPRPSKSPSDSDIRLQGAEEGGGKKKKGEDNAVTEEIIDLDAEEASLSQMLPVPGKSRVSPSNPALPTGSPFELSEADFAFEEEGEARPPSKGAKKSAMKKAEEDSSSDFEVVAFDASKSPGDLGSGEIPLLAGDEEVELGADLTPSARNSGINLDDPADSGISLEEEEGSGGEVEFELTLESGATPKPSTLKQQKEEPAAAEEEESSSEFELSVDEPSGEDSSSEFELSVDDDSSSEFELSLDDDSAAPSDPSSSEFELSLDDSGETSGVEEESGSDSEFELTLDDEGALAVDDDEVGFEPTNFDVPALDDEEEESGSQAVPLEDSETDLEGEDFEISLDDSESESGSQVVSIDEDEEADENAPTIAKPRAAALKGKGKAKTKAAPAVVEEEEDEDAGLDFDLDEEEEDSAPKKKPAAKKAKAKAAAKVPDEEEDEDEDEDEDAAAQAAAPVAAPPAQWGAMPALTLIPTVIVLFLVCFMGYELIQGMFGFQRPAKASKPVVDLIARPVAENVMDAPLPDSQPAKPGN